MIAYDSFATGYSTNDNDFQFTLTHGDLGSHGLIVVLGVGQETSGEENPEEINVIYFMHPVNGWTAMTKIADANIQQSGYSLYYVRGSQLPSGAGNLSIGVNYKDNPKTPNVCRAIAAAFKNVKDGVLEANNQGTSDSGGTRSIALTTITKNSLVVGAFGERTSVGWSESSSPAFTTIGTNTGGENNGYCGMYYRLVSVPASTTFSVNATNPEGNAVFIASFAPQKISGGAII